MTIEPLEVQRIERETAEKIFAELWGECPHYKRWQRQDCMRCLIELQTKYLGDRDILALLQGDKEEGK